jgi:predicted nuclease of restriction endonuclease-like (RecB) superfamily
MKQSNREKDNRRALGRSRKEACFTAPPPVHELPSGYGETLAELKDILRSARLKTVLAANASMVLAYWDIGRTILERQKSEGWGAKVVDRFSADLRKEFPDMQGLSPRNLKYMRAFADAWPDRSIVQRVIAQIPWRQNIALLERLSDPAARLWYAEQTIQNGWSQPILCLQIEQHLHERQGKAITNFPATLPPTDSDMAAQLTGR